VDRPNTGHRHEAGSITVVDLIRRQQGPVRIPSADEEATVQFMDDLLGSAQEQPDHHRGWLSRGAKLAGLALGSLALCGSVYAASTLTHRAPTADATSRPETSVLTGIGALRPDTVAAQLSGGHPGTTPTTHPNPMAKAITGHASGTIVGHAAPTEPRPSVRPHPSLATPEDVVRAFYQLVATDPSLAANLLTPSMLSDSSGFDEAWDSMSRIEVDSVRQTSDHTVQAVVRMLEPDGSWVRVVELLHVSGGDAPLINGAELLSAQHG
jgi:hypothetical protein